MQQAGTRLKALYEAETEAGMARTGRVKGADGEYGPADRLADVSPSAQHQRLTYVRGLLQQLDGISLDELSAEDRINAAVFRTNLEHALIDGKARQWEMPFNSDSSFWTYLDQARSLRTAEDYDAYIARMRDIPRYFDQQKANMRDGLARGFSVPRVTLEGREASITNFITDTAEANGFYAAFRQMPSTVSVSDQARLRADAATVINEAVIPAYRSLLDFYLKEYQPRARTTLAARDMPDGVAFYESQVRKYTTLDLSGEEIHQIGLAEVARIQAEMRQTMADTIISSSGVLA
jgi:uncharacterized protein (DUF885 family)